MTEGSRINNLVNDWANEKSTLTFLLKEWRRIFYDLLNYIVHHISKNKRAYVCHSSFIDFFAILFIFLIGYLMFLVPEILGSPNNSNIYKASISILINIIDDCILAILIISLSRKMDNILSDPHKYIPEINNNCIINEKISYFLNFLNNGLNINLWRIKRVAIPTVIAVLYTLVTLSGSLDIPDYDLFLNANTSFTAYAKLYTHLFVLGDSLITGYAIGLSLCFSVSILLISFRIPFERLSPYKTNGGITELGNGLMKSHMLFLMAVVLPVFFIDITELITFGYKDDLINNIEIGAKRIVFYYLLYSLVLSFIPVYILHKKLEKVKDEKIYEITNQLDEHMKKFGGDKLDTDMEYYTKHLYLLSLHERIGSADTLPIKNYSVAANLILALIVAVLTAWPFVKVVFT